MRLTTGHVAQRRRPREPSAPDARHLSYAYGHSTVAGGTALDQLLRTHDPLLRTHATPPRRGSSSGVLGETSRGDR